MTQNKIQELYNLTKTEGIKMYDEKMKEANALFTEAIEIKKAMEEMDDTIKPALAEYETLSTFEKDLLDTVIEVLLAEAKKAIGGKK
ncbi:hypothetical protein F6Y03_30875 [Bacillus megaterium]|jgi:hypothetical protein|nr:hypothetical protein [Priestia megaterium]